MKLLIGLVVLVLLGFATLGYAQISDRLTIFAEASPVASITFNNFDPGITHVFRYISEQFQETKTGTFDVPPFGSSIPSDPGVFAFFPEGTSNVTFSSESLGSVIVNVSIDPIKFVVDVTDPGFDKELLIMDINSEVCFNTDDVRILRIIKSNGEFVKELGIIPEDAEVSPSLACAKTFSCVSQTDGIECSGRVDKQNLVCSYKVIDGNVGCNKETGTTCKSRELYKDDIVCGYDSANDFCTFKAKESAAATVCGGGCVLKQPDLEGKLTCATLPAGLEKICEKTSVRDASGISYYGREGVYTVIGKGIADEFCEPVTSNTECEADITYSTYTVSGTTETRDFSRVSNCRAVLTEAKVCGFTFTDGIGATTISNEFCSVFQFGSEVSCLGTKTYEDIGCVRGEFGDRNCYYTPSPKLGGVEYTDESNRFCEVGTDTRIITVPHLIKRTCNVITQCSTHCHMYTCHRGDWGTCGYKRDCSFWDTIEIEETYVTTCGLKVGGSEVNPFPSKCDWENPTNELERCRYESVKPFEPVKCNTPQGCACTVCESIYPDASKILCNPSAGGCTVVSSFVKDTEEEGGPYCEKVEGTVCVADPTYQGTTCGGPDETGSCIVSSTPVEDTGGGFCGNVFDGCQSNFDGVTCKFDKEINGCLVDSVEQVCWTPELGEHRIEDVRTGKVMIVIGYDKRTPLVLDLQRSFVRSTNLEKIISENIVGRLEDGWMTIGVLGSLAYVYTVRYKKKKK